MTEKQFDQLRNTILELVPADGSTIGNKALQEALTEKLGGSFPEEDYWAARDALIAKGVLAKGRGRGGSVYRTDPASLELQEQTGPSPKSKKKAGKKKSRRKKAGPKSVLQYRHEDKRKNNPPVGLVKPETDPEQPRTEWAYDPHLDPELRFDVGRAQIENIIDDALSSGNEATMREALAELKRLGAPYLSWTGKVERTSFEVDTVSLHVHERVDPMGILSGLKKRYAKGEAGQWRQPDLLAAPFENLPLRDAVDFYRHERGWSNRLIAGDSLQVMNSLIQKESMAGQVQMIYIDPPYGIKYGSNFQPFVNKRDVKDRKDEDLTQEPEMIKAFRDTWELGIHSYLTYLRDRLLLARELLSESGSIFVQISDDNLHHVREILDEVFGGSNFIALISFQKTGGLVSKGLVTTVDYICWYGKDEKKTKFNQLFKQRKPGEPSLDRYDLIRFKNGKFRRLRKEEKLTDSIVEGRRARHVGLESANPRFEFDFHGIPYQQRWKTNTEGLRRLSRSHRIAVLGSRLNSWRYLDDFPVIPLTDRWESMQIGKELTYVVQTAFSAVQNCMLLTTDPGDLIFDPTCGSGTTAHVAEAWGRRWITCDTSRVAVTLTKQRLMTASYDYYELKYPQEGLKGGFVYKTVPHITLKSIANNPDIDEIYERMHPGIERALGKLNDAVKGQKLQFRVSEGGRKGEAVDFSAPSSKQVELPSGEKARVNELLEWEVPFEFPDDWPKKARKPFDEFHRARQAMQEQMDESIAAHADHEVLYDQPEKSRDKLRITGPFTVEAVPFPTVVSMDEAETPREADAAIARSGESARHHEWRDELVRTGLRGKGGQRLKVAELESLPSGEGFRNLHCVGTLDSGERIVVSFGPEYAALEQRQVALALNEAEKLRPAPKFVVFAAFTFDPEAAKDIDETTWPGVTLLKAEMNKDLLTEDLKKKRASNESFWLMGQPDVEARKREDGHYEVEVHGFDYFDTAKGELVSGGKGKIALWMLDTDYDERSLFPQQVFFPMAGKKDGWHRLKKDIRAELDESRLEAFHGTVSLPFEAGENRKAAVKIVDDRGIESLKIIQLPD